MLAWRMQCAGSRVPLAWALKLPPHWRAAVQVPCRHGCGEEYCSSECEAQAWEAHHCLLCPPSVASQAGARWVARLGSDAGTCLAGLSGWLGR